MISRVFFLLFISLHAQGKISNIFYFENSFECNHTFPNFSFCSAAGFKPWSQEEKSQVINLIDSLPQKQLKHFFKTIQEKGITKLHRASHSTRWVPNHSERRVDFVREDRQAAIWVNPVTKVVGFSDTFFKKESVVDPYTGLERKVFVILHELAHVFDLAGRYSSTGTFLNILNWSYREGNWSPRGVSALEVKNYFSVILELARDKNLQEAYSLDRNLGHSYGYPTLYSMTSFQESFAELLAYSVLDPDAKDYLPKKILDYFDIILNHKTK